MTKVNMSSSSLNLYLRFSETESLTNSGAHYLSQVDCPIILKDLLCLSLYRWDDRKKQQSLDFDMRMLEMRTLVLLFV